ncbi:MAG: death on curing protein [Thermoanaerobaculia bacterium]|nr:death on curing protein [Thermoanaerobaculia bacterium]
MRYISIEEVVELHRRVIEQSGGAFGLRDQGSLESSVRQPLQAFGDHDLYPTLAEKAAALGFFLIQNHPFLDGNKRIGHAALETVLLLNGHELAASVDEQERIVLSVARGELDREQFTAWVQQHVVSAS